MRRRRQQLQVSTFPFLAVLLCAMGSLILLLLVIDRRAKAVARAKAMQAYTRRTEEDARVVAARKAEWERRRQALHALLAGQDQELVGKIKAVEDEARSRAAALEEARARFAAMEKELRAERSRLDEGKTAVATWQTTATQTAKRTEAARKELAGLNEELERLAQTLKDLKLLRRRDQQTYSLVPYRGRRGDSRKPVYVECLGDGVIFHPDRRALRGFLMTAGAVRAEVERQIARKRAEIQTVANKKDDTPYLLLLVRPDGITSYYKTLAALEGLHFDYGYEFVEADWLLDFDDKEDLANRPAWMNAGAAGAPQAPGFKMKPRTGRLPAFALRSGTGLPGTDTGPHGPGGPGTGTGGGGPAGSGTGPSGIGPSGSGTGPVGGNSAAGATGQDPGGALPGSGTAGGGSDLFPTPTMAGLNSPNRVRGVNFAGGSPGGGGSGIPGDGSGSAPGAGGIGRGIAGTGSGSGFGPGGPGRGEGGLLGVPSPDPSSPWRPLGGNSSPAPLTPGTRPGLAAGSGIGTGGPNPTGLLADAGGLGHGIGGPQPLGGSAGGGPGGPWPSGGSGGTGPGTPSLSGLPGVPGGAGTGPGGSNPSAGMPGMGSGTGGTGSGSPGTGSGMPGATNQAGGTGSAGAGAGGPDLSGGTPGTGNGKAVPTGLPGLAGGPQGQPGGTAPTGGAPGGAGGAPGNGGTPGGTGAAGQAGQGSNSGGPSGRPSGAQGGSPADGPQPPGEASFGSPISAGGGDGGGGSLGSRSHDFADLVPEQRSGRPERSAPPLVLSRVIGNRDWVIPIVCRADGIVLPITRSRYTLDQLAASPGAVNPLFEEVRQMIARRQALVRPGETPYRVKVRFEVWPDGVGTYYRVYPLLEGLNVPLARQDIEDDHKPAGWRR